MSFRTSWLLVLLLLPVTSVATMSTPRFQAEQSGPEGLLQAALQDPTIVGRFDYPQCVELFLHLQNLSQTLRPALVRDHALAALNLGANNTWAGEYDVCLRYALQQRDELLSQSLSDRVKILVSVAYRILKSQLEQEMLPPQPPLSLLLLN